MRTRSGGKGAGNFSGLLARTVEAGRPVTGGVARGPGARAAAPERSAPAVSFRKAKAIDALIGTNPQPRARLVADGPTKRSPSARTRRARAPSALSCVAASK